MTFVITQPILRIPMITFLSHNSIAINQLQVQNPILYILLLALSAGIFEETGRYLVIRFVLKNYTSWYEGIILGLGHGEVEAFLLVGWPLLINLFSGTVMNASNIEFLIGAIERIFTICLHVGLSVLVMKTVKSSNYVYFIMAILIHTFVDAIAGIVPIFVSNSVFIVESILAIVSMLLLLYIISLRKRWKLS